MEAEVNEAAFWRRSVSLSRHCTILAVQPVRTARKHGWNRGFLRMFSSPWRLDTSACPKPKHSSARTCVSSFSKPRLWSIVLFRIGAVPLFEEERRVKCGSHGSNDVSRGQATLNEVGKAQLETLACDVVEKQAGWFPLCVHLSSRVKDPFTWFHAVRLQVY